MMIKNNYHETDTPCIQSYGAFALAYFITKELIN